MDLNDFEKRISEIILEEGLSYYEMGKIVSLEYDGKEWDAVVEGTQDYAVSIALAENGKISDSRCDCPYGMSRLCEHQAAVLYALRDRLRSKNAPERIKERERIKEMLEGLDKSTLISIVAEFAERDEGMKEEMVMRHIGKADIIGSARNVIQAAIRSAERYGHVDYGDAERAVSGATAVFDIIDERTGSGDIVTAVSLCIVILEEMLILLERCDDSNGYVGAVIGEAIERTEKMVSHPVAREHGRKIFDAVFDHSLNERYDGWEWRHDLLFALIPLCVIPENRSRMESFIFSSPEKKRADKWTREYETRKMQLLHYGMIKHVDGDAAADSYRETHTDNRDIRMAALKDAIEKGSYEKAMDLCSEGETKDVEYPALLNVYKKYRYEIYGRTGDVQAQREVGLDLLTDGDGEYYPKSKELYGKDEWVPIRQKILKELNTFSHKGLYANILVKEGLKKELLEFCKINAYAIMSYHAHLLPEYKDDVRSIFVTYIKVTAASARDRNAYRNVCDIIKKYRKVCGVKADAIVDELIERYSRRPAFVDELMRI